jgi:ribosome maturation factor RimP
MVVLKEALGRGIERLVSSEGYELVQLEFKLSSGAHVLRIYIDKPGGVTLDDCQKISRQVSTFLDVEDPIQHRYLLEVSSPGLDRGLYKESDYVRFNGRSVRVKTRHPIENRRNFRGRLEASGDGKIRIIEPDGRTWSLELSVVEKANLEIEI